MSLSILVVDDSKTVRKMIKKELRPYFEERGAEMTEAKNGKEALSLCLNNQYDIVFLDLTMPEMTGYEVLEALQQKGVTLKIVVLTADVQPGVEKRVRELGAAGYLKKPLDVHEAIKVLKECELI